MGLISQEPHRFNSWGELCRAFIDNFIATCDQPGNKYDLQRIREDRGQPLREYIRRFSDTLCSILRVTDDEAVNAFIHGLLYHDALRDKLLRKRPTTVQELHATAKKYTDADDTLKLINEDKRRHRPDHPP